jgi:hypothetical protein
LTLLGKGLVVKSDPVHLCDSLLYVFRVSIFIRNEGCLPGLTPLTVGALSLNDSSARPPEVLRVNGSIQGTFGMMNDELVVDVNADDENIIDVCGHENVRQLYQPIPSGHYSLFLCPRESHSLLSPDHFFYFSHHHSSLRHPGRTAVPKIGGRKSF